VHATDAVNAVWLRRQIGDVAAVITEMDLPGPWNAKQLREALHHLQPEVPVIVVSTRSTYEEVAAAWDMPFLRKPFSAENLFALLPAADASGCLNADELFRSFPSFFRFTTPRRWRAAARPYGYSGCLIARDAGFTPDKTR